MIYNSKQQQNMQQNMQQNANLERLDRHLVQMLGNAPLCRVYTLEEVKNLLFEQRNIGSSFLEFNGLMEEKAAAQLNKAGFKITVAPVPNVYRSKTTVSW